MGFFSNLGKKLTEGARNIGKAIVENKDLIGKVINHAPDALQMGSNLLNKTRNFNSESSPMVHSGMNKLIDNLKKGRALYNEHKGKIPDSDFFRVGEIKEKNRFF